MESHPILITTRDSSHATQRHSNVLERTFLTAADHDNRSRIQNDKKISERSPLSVRWDKLYTRMSPDHGNLFFASPSTFSKTQMSYENDVHRQLRVYYILRDLFSFSSRSIRNVCSEKSSFYLWRLYPVIVRRSLFKLHSVRIELRQIEVP